MQDAQTLFGHPGIGLLSMLVIGAIAGWIPERVTTPITAFLPTSWSEFAAPLSAASSPKLQVPVFGFWRPLIAATIGAILLLFVWRTIRRRA